MGITGLLPLLREAQRPAHVRELAGRTVGVDSYVWIYKGAFSCAAELVLGTPTTAYVDYVMRRVRLLKHMNVTPYMVFDGGKLPSKEHTELERSARRKRNLEEGLRQWRESNRKAANDYFQRCLEVTPEMTKCIIEELKREGVEYLVAPYEADAQLAYLERQGIISAVITEDSDLLPYGFKHVFFKMDQWGNGTLFDRSLLPEVKGVSLRGWTDDRFRQLCILSGCDYLASVPGIGLKKAYKYMAKTRDIATVIRTMRMNGLQVPVDYYEGFQRADLTFLYQRVYDPINKQLATVSPLPEGMNADNMPYVGRYIEPKIARGIAEGDLDPITLGPLRVNNRFPQIALRPGMVFYPGSKPTQQITSSGEGFKRKLISDRMEDSITTIEASGLVRQSPLEENGVYTGRQGVINDLASAFRKKAKSVEPFIETGTTSPFFNHSQPVSRPSETAFEPGIDEYGSQDGSATASSSTAVAATPTSTSVTTTGTTLAIMEEDEGKVAGSAGDKENTPPSNQTGSKDRALVVKSEDEGKVAMPTPAHTRHPFSTMSDPFKRHVVVLDEKGRNMRNHYHVSTPTLCRTSAKDLKYPPSISAYLPDHILAPSTPPIKMAAVTATTTRNTAFSMAKAQPATRRRSLGPNRQFKSPLLKSRTNSTAPANNTTLDTFGFKRKANNSSEW